MVAVAKMAERVAELTPREREVLGYIGRGFSLREIAETMHRSIKTVETHRAALGRKLRAGNRVELAHAAIEAGLVPSATDQPPYRTLVESMTGGVAMTDAGGRIVYVNQALCDMLGHPASRMRGRPVTDFMSEDSARLFIEMQEQRERDALSHYEIDLCHADGVTFRARVAPRSMFDESGRFVGSFGIVLPIDKA